MTKNLRYDVQVTLVELGEEFRRELQDKLDVQTIVVTVLNTESLSYDDCVNFGDGRKHIVAFPSRMFLEEIEFILPPETHYEVYRTSVESDEKVAREFRRRIGLHIFNYRKTQKANARGKSSG